MKIDTDSTVLTPNRRLSATLLQKYNQQQLANQRFAWPTLDILPYTTWIHRLWKSITDLETTQYYLLSSEKELILWEEIIKKIPENSTLLQQVLTADTAQSAFNILQQWQIPLDHELLQLTEDAQNFLKWVHIFKNQCQ